MGTVSASAVQAQIQGDVQGQVAVGDYVIQIGSVHGGVVNIGAKTQRVQLQPRARPVHLRPRRFRGFLDREAQVQAVDEAAQAEMPIVFHGEAGIGKTVLLRHLAYYPPGVSLSDGVVHLSARRTPLADLLLALYDAFYERPADVKPTETQMRQALRDVRALVLLDDLALERDEIGDLLDAVPRCIFVMTAKKRLLWGEGRAVRLPGLPKAAALRLLEAELGRALDAKAADSAQALIQAVDGHPLRLLQAAAQVREADGDWDEVLEALKKLEPAQALTAQAIQSLSDAQRRILALLAVSGDAPLPEEHLAALAGVDNLGAVLETLQQQKMVEAHSPRYTLTGDLAERLRSAWDLTPWAERMLRYFADWATAHRDSPDRLTDAVEMLMAVMEWGVRLQRWPEALRLARALEGALALSGRWGIWSHVLQSALQAGQSLGDQAAEAWARHQQGSRALCLGEKAVAREQLVRALRMRESLGDEVGAAITRHNLNLLLAPPAPPEEPPQPPPEPVPGASGGLPLLAKVALGIVAVAAIGLGIWQLWPWPAPPVEMPAAVTITPTETVKVTPTLTETPTPSPSTTPDRTGPSAPSLFVPEPREEVICGDNVNQTAVRFEWGRVSDPSGLLEYQVEVERIERSPYLYPVERTRDPYLTMVLPCNEVFSWQVRAVDGAENAGPWSQSQIFFLNYNLDDPPPTDIGEVTIVGPFVEEEAQRFESSMVPFEERTGIDIIYEGSGDFETLMLVRLEAGELPDIAVFFQPGLLFAFVNSGQVQDLNDWFDEGYLEAQYARHWLDMATMDNIMAGVWYRARVKSLVWYPVPWFEEFGYQIPETWDEMLALSDQMLADGNTPWCIGMESGPATGWVATDWMEDIMLRMQPVDAYDAWVNGDLPFESPEVKNAAEIMGDIWFNEEWVFGGTDAILEIPFNEAPSPMFDEPPGCYLHRQASFIPAFFPEDVTLGEDVDFFYLPPMNPDEFPRPVLGTGDLFAAFNDRPEVREAMEYLTTGESTRAWLQSGDFVSPHNDTPLDWYPTDIDRRYAEILSEATVVRFDGSDLMPDEVGRGSFWIGMVDYVSARGENLDEVMKYIDASWPD